MSAPESQPDNGKECATADKDDREFHEDQRRQFCRFTVDVIFDDDLQTEHAVIEAGQDQQDQKNGVVVRSDPRLKGREVGTDDANARIDEPQNQGDQCDPADPLHPEMVRAFVVGAKTADAAELRAHFHGSGPHHVNGYERQRRERHSRDEHDDAARAELRQLEPATGVPDQVTNTVAEVIPKREHDPDQDQLADPRAENRLRRRINVCAIGCRHQ